MEPSKGSGQGSRAWPGHGTSPGPSAGTLDHSLGTTASRCHLELFYGGEPASMGPSSPVCCPPGAAWAKPTGTGGWPALLPSATLGRVMRDAGDGDAHPAWGGGCTLPSLLGPPKHWQAERWGWHLAGTRHWGGCGTAGARAGTGAVSLPQCRSRCAGRLRDGGTGTLARPHPAAWPRQGLTTSNSAWSSSGTSLVS